MLLCHKLKNETFLHNVCFDDTFVKKLNMLIDFKTENFLSFKNLTALSMTGVRSFKEHEETNLIRVDEKTSLLKSAVIYGNNGSGKSNFIKALRFMKRLVQNSFRDALLEDSDQKIPVQKFLLNSESEKANSFFEVKFIIDDLKFRYGFEIQEEEISSEWLFHTTTKEVFLFKRDGQKIDVNKTSFKEGLGLEEKTKSNVLFLSLVAQFNGITSNSVVSWFKTINYINGITDHEYERYTINKLKSDKEFHLWVSEFVKFLEISNIDTSETDDGEENDKILNSLKKREKDEELAALLSSVQRIQAKQPKLDRIVTWHRKYDKDNVLIGTVSFPFEKYESEGTKKLVYLLGPWYDTIRNGKILIVDELDSRLHTVLTAKLIEFFHKGNKSKAQLICAVHDTSILDKDIFRRDQIWFVEKNQFGASELYSLSDFKSAVVRNKSDFDKNYINGKYGAIPYFANLEKLASSIYGEE